VTTDEPPMTAPQAVESLGVHQRLAGYIEEQALNLMDYGR
jgi:hypothetical protein